MKPAHAAHAADPEPTHCCCREQSLLPPQLCPDTLAALVAQQRVQALQEAHQQAHGLAAPSCCVQESRRQLPLGCCGQKARL
jgi:hypothetical protein